MTEAPATRLRVVEFHIQPVIMADDGEHLTPVQSKPIVLPAADLDTFPASFREDLAEAEAAMNEGGERVAGHGASEEV